MYCQNCGMELPDGAQFCLKCGEPVAAPITRQLEVPQKCTLVVNRLVNPNNTGPAEIWVNGERKTLIHAKETVTIELPPGFLNVSIEQKNQKSIVYSIQVNSGETKTLTFKPADRGSPRQVPIVVNDPAGGNINMKDPLRCHRCGSKMNPQLVTESRKSGCGTIFLYVLLALTLLGLLIVIPLALRNKTETVTYAICPNCGFRRPISRK